MFMESIQFLFLMINNSNFLRWKFMIDFALTKTNLKKFTEDDNPNELGDLNKRG